MKISRHSLRTRSTTGCFNLSNSSSVGQLRILFNMTVIARWALLLAFNYAVVMSFSPVLIQGRRKTNLCNKADLMSDEDKAMAMEKATKAMTAFTNTYLKNTGTTLCADKSVPAVVIKGLAEHKVTLGAPLCPCRFYEDKEAEAKDGYWNCPCVPMRERHECHCMLFLTEDNAFAGPDQNISLEDVQDASKAMK